MSGKSIFYAVEVCLVKLPKSWEVLKDTVEKEDRLSFNSSESWYCWLKEDRR